MRINNFNNKSFYGYKNVIHNDIETDSFKFMFLSMQLDDNGAKDLTEFRKIRTLEKKSADTDVLNVIYSKIKYKPAFFFFDGRAMYSGEELKQLSEQYSYSNVYKQEERATLKAYTLIANITKRMMHNALTEMNGNIGKVMQSAMESFMNIVSSNPASIFNMLHGSILENKQLDKTAAQINKLIVQNMDVFFK